MRIQCMLGSFSRKEPGDEASFWNLKTLLQVDKVIGDAIGAVMMTLFWYYRPEEAIGIQSADYQKVYTILVYTILIMPAFSAEIIVLPGKTFLNSEVSSFQETKLTGLVFFFYERVTF